MPVSCVCVCAKTQIGDTAAPETPKLGSEEFLEIWEIDQEVGSSGNRWVEGTESEHFEDHQLQQLRYEDLGQAVGDAPPSALRPKLAAWARWLEFQTSRGDPAFKRSPVRLV